MRPLSCICRTVWKLCFSSRWACWQTTEILSPEVEEVWGYQGVSHFLSQIEGLGSRKTKGPSSSAGSGDMDGNWAWALIEPVFYSTIRVNHGLIKQGWKDLNVLQKLFKFVTKIISIPPTFLSTWKPSTSNTSYKNLWWRAWGTCSPNAYELQALFAVCQQHQHQFDQRQSSMHQINNRKEMK